MTKEEAKKAFGLWLDLRTSSEPKDQRNIFAARALRNRLRRKGYRILTLKGKGFNGGPGRFLYHVPDKGKPIFL